MPDPKRLLSTEEVAEMRRRAGTQAVDTRAFRPADIHALCDTVDALREALRPLAALATHYTSLPDDHLTTYWLRVGDTRRAAELVKGRV